MTAAPRRQLGLGITAAIVVANMIGTGIFISTGFQAASIHDPLTILVAWVVGGVIALCGASCYAELGSMMPEAGGEYVYLREAYHPVAGFVSGWVSLTAGFSAPIAAAALTFAGYFATLLPAFAGAATQKIVAIALIVAITGLHSFDTKVGGWVQAAFTATKVLLITVFIVAGLCSGNGDWSHFHFQHGGLSNIGTSAFAIALMYVSFAYSGWNAAAYIASDVKKPARTLPRSLLLGTGIVMALYVLLNVVYFYAVPSDGLAGVLAVGDKAARTLFGDGAGRLITSLIALALVSAVSAMVMAGPRVYAAMAEDRALPPQLAWHSARGVPSVAVIAQGVIAIGFVLAMNPAQLIEFVGFTLAISAAFTVAAVFVMRLRGARAAYRTFGYPVTPIVFIAASAWIAYAQIRVHPLASLIVGMVLAVGAALYVVLRPASPPPAKPVLPEARVVE
ncbi:MAG TPA: amino acid permease [Kofleriaceae bacterium]|nr:amino acid permease [Kofleriaceae bacterium]